MKENTEPEEITAAEPVNGSDVPQPVLSEEDEDVILKRLQELGYLE